jgi:thiol:disulfide interchange protein
MNVARVAAVFAVSASLSSLAWAGGESSPKPPAPPPIDFSGLPAEASVRPKQAGDKPHPVIARLVVDHASVAPGDTLRVGVLLEQDVGWHTYWRSPGDIGKPTLVDWKLPDGTTAKPFVFPVPQRFELEGVVSYGYDERSFVFSQVTLPKDVAGNVTIGASVQWLVCLSECIEGAAQLSTTVPVGASTPSAFAPLFDHYAKQLPTPLTQVAEVAEEHALSASALRSGDDFVALILLQPTGSAHLSAPPAAGTWPTVTPIADGNVFLSETLVAATPEGGLLVAVTGTATPGETLPESSPVGALFQFDVGDKHVATEVAVPFGWADPSVAVATGESPLWDMAKKLLNVERPTLAPGQAPPPPAPDAPPPASVAEAAPVSAPLMLVLAFLGGLLLNVMPCVLPVLTLKMYGLVESGAEKPAERQKAGLAYTAGIVVSFWVLASVVLGLKATIGGVGWGFQFQYPGYVAVLTSIVFAFALSMFGVFEIPAVGANHAGEAASREGLAGHFLTGVFATLLGTPCSAPFLGPAIGFAFSQSAPVTLLFFTIVGLGLAAPFLLVAFVPALFRFMPAPGDWMDTFKQLMGFSLIATSVWLYGVLQSQLGADSAGWYLAFLVVVALGAWAFGRFGGVVETTGRQVAVGLASLALIGGGWWLFVDLTPAPAESCDNGELTTEGLDYSKHIPYQPFSEERLAALKDKVVFVDFTADWCLTCKVNEKTVLETDAVRAAMADVGVVPLVADWTRRDPVITTWLERHQRAGVPMYLVLPKNGGAAIQLPEVITSGMVIDAVYQAAGRTPPGAK